LTLKNNKGQTLCRYCGTIIVIDDGRDFCNGACFDNYHDDACSKEEKIEKIRYKMCLELGRQILTQEVMISIINKYKLKEVEVKMLKNCEIDDCPLTMSCVRCTELVELYKKLVKE